MVALLAVLGAAAAASPVRVASSSLEPGQLPERRVTTLAHFSAAGACFAGDERTIEGALAFLQAGPHAAAFAHAQAEPGPCATAGRIARSHFCYAQVVEYHDTAATLDEHDALLRGALDAFAMQQHVSREFAQRLADCSCQPMSDAGMRAASQPGRCNATELGFGSFTHIDEYGADGAATEPREVLCNQGPWQHQLAVLATLKSSPLRMMHQRDALRPVNCIARGFLYYLGWGANRSAAVNYGFSRSLDHCYPPSTLWARSEINQTNPDIQRIADFEDAILGRGNYSNASSSLFAEDVLARGLNRRVLDNEPDCNCLAYSSIGNGTDPGEGPDVPALCAASNGTAQHSPVRDWWSGYPDTPAPEDADSPPLRPTPKPVS